jgi:predicted nucleic acid-binding protein
VDLAQPLLTLFWHSCHRVLSVLAAAKEPLSGCQIAHRAGTAEHTALNVLDCLAIVGRALATLNEWPAAGTTLYTSGQILREYLAVATRPAADNGLGLAQRDAITNVRAYRGRLRLAAETQKVADRLLVLIDEIDCTGKQLHDANVVATMLIHGVDTLVTLNAGDVARYEDHVSVLTL